jgi:anti-sigma regulatory factor (Ser/Thr protein kinase)
MPDSQTSSASQAETTTSNFDVSATTDTQNTISHGAPNSRVEAHIAATNAPPDEDISLRIPSNAEYVRVVRLAVTGIASRMPFSYEDIEDIKLAVSEACNNAILHAQAKDEPLNNAAGMTPSSAATAPKPPITVTVTPRADRLEISVEDGGHVPPPGLKPPSFKPRTSQSSTHANATASATGNAEDVPEGGMGLF